MLGEEELQGILSLLDTEHVPAFAFKDSRSWICNKSLTRYLASRFEANENELPEDYLSFSIPRSLKKNEVTSIKGRDKKSGEPTEMKVWVVTESLFLCVVTDQTPAEIKDFESVTEGTSDAFFALDEDWRFIYINKNAAEILNLNPPELIGKNIWEDVFPEAKGTSFYNAFQKAKNEKVRITIEDYFQPWDKWFESRATPYKGGLFIFFQEITKRKNIELRLKRINNVLTEAQKLGNMATWEWDLNSNIVWWSDYLYEIIGVKKGSFTPSFFSFVRLVHPDDQDILRKGISDTLHSEEVNRIDFRIVNKDTTISYFKSIAQLYKDHLGRNEKVIGVVSDITDLESSRREVVEFNRTLEKQVQDRTRSLIEAQSNLKALIENTRDGIWSMNQDKKLTTFNQSFNKSYKILTGRDLQIGMTLREILDPVVYKPYYDFWNSLTEKALKGETLVAEYPIQLDDRKIIYLISCSPIRIGKSIGGATFFSKNITDRKKAEEQIIDLNKNLTEKVGELEIMNNDLNAFSYSVSHDLRSPLRAISGFSEMIARRLDKVENNEVIELIELVKKNINKMEMLIQDLLEFSKTGRKTVSKAEVNMNELVSALVEDFKSKQETANKIRFIIHPLPSCKADFALMTQVLINLLSNAIKYSSKEKNPEIEISSKDQEDKVIYSIRDNGVGFDMKYYDKLFGVFYRLHSETEFEGTGVGLALVKRIIQKHGGDVWAEAELNKGAEFFFSVPK